MLRSTSFIIPVTALSIALLAVAAVVTLSKIEKEARIETGAALQTILTTSRQAFHIWAEELQRETQVWAQTADIKSVTRELLKVEHNQEALLQSPAQERIRNLLEPVVRGKGYLGFFIIAPDKSSLASARDINTGVLNPLSSQPLFLNRALAGEPTLSLPQFSEVPLPDQAGRMREGVPTMFVGAPIVDDDGAVIAVLTFRVDPRADFTTLFQRGRLGQTGETYAFNRAGNLVTESRFDSQLRGIGLIGSDQHAILNISIRNPGANLVAGENPASPRDRQPLTLMAESAISGETGMNLEGYRDYRGVEVIGAWLWDEDHGIGVATEIDTAEVDGYLVTTRAAFFGFALVAALTLIGLAYASEFNRRRIIRVNEALVSAQSANERFVSALDHLGEGLALWGQDGRLLISNDAARKPAGSAGEELQPGITFEEWARAHLRYGMVPEAVGREEEWVAERLAYFENPGEAIEIQRGGRWYLFQLQKLPDGSTMHSVIDIHDRKLNEEALHRMHRMEAIGQLTGGVAHDFNNLLGVMLGNAERVKPLLGDNEKARHHVEEVIGAIDRSASLTQRLLSFSRQQVLLPATTDVGGLVQGLEDMLRRTLGETVDLKVTLGAQVWSATVDTHQFENALLNVAINARDAMPNGGALTIGTENVTLDDAYAEQHEELLPGDYVKVTVSDTGTGIEPEDLDKVFEPFFTTKGVGEGSGLGLSMVYGFAKQSKGHITIASEVGRGTTVELYLPRSNEAAEESDAIDAGLEEFVRRSERILVVEDDKDLREIPVSLFRDQGFEVVEAKDGAEALEHLRDGAAFDLLFSDVVLPGGMSGVEIAEEARRRQPDIKVLLTTGYAQSAIAENRADGDVVHVISKPYRGIDLLAKVTSLLDEGSIQNQEV